ncbi:hypothetical protein I8751_13970 [Nostocaceae cyanobacterium CENA357]|uniref:Uncharacterized protein n=1 Tax=Atlanticothrix silvestris CENA357 TaxID=1725252 RepID=A0A8J7HJ12_9CYAN|nr:hypothetical protein [Atlanticothrix silvestris]MBH8553461.1 hypothetical protein [Atlanticothrix silvestris CENA357]
MKYINPRSLAYLGKVVFAATSVAMFSPVVSAYAASGLSTTDTQILNNAQGQQLLAITNIKLSTRRNSLKG